MASRRFKQMVINIKWKNTYYNIRAESIKPTLKQDSEEYTATNSIKPYAIAFEGQSELLFNITTYDYDVNRKLKNRDWWTGCIITELSNESAEPFDVKCSAQNWG